MSADKRSRAVLQATAARQPLPAVYTNSKNRRSSSQKEKTTYFNICCYDMSEPDEPELVEELQAGKSYLLAITCDGNPSSINKATKRQDGKPISGPFSLTLSYAYDTSITTPIAPAKKKFLFSDSL